MKKSMSFIICLLLALSTLFVFVGCDSAEEEGVTTIKMSVVWNGLSSMKPTDNDNRIAKIIRQKTGVKIDITDDGTVFIATNNQEMSDKAKRIIMAIVKEPEIGDEFTGKVVRIMNFGAFVELAPGKDGMIHISKLAKERVENVTDVVNIGDTVHVKVIKIDEKGRIDLKLIKKL